MDFNKNNKILIRADASVEIGTGHAMRCIALAQQWLDQGGVVHWAYAEIPDFIKNRLIHEGIHCHHVAAKRGTIHDTEQTSQLALRHSDKWVILDGYVFNGEFQDKIQKADRRVMVIDDNGETGPWKCDVILNQNSHAECIDYSTRSENCELLLGSKYVLLRRELVDALKKHDCSQYELNDLRLLVLVGGSDHQNITSKILSFIGENKTSKSLAIRVILGGANTRKEEIDKIAKSINISVEIFQSARDMSEHYSWCNCAITAAGSTCWELCAFGIPFYPIAVVQNQEKIANQLGGSIWGSDTLLRLKNWLESPQSIKLKEIDGYGAKRVSSIFKRPLQIQIAMSDGSWMEKYLPQLVKSLEGKENLVWRVSKANQIKQADVTFMLSFQELVGLKMLALSCHTLVVHGSDLPKGRGWSPWVWEIIAGANNLKLTLFEASDKVDSGKIYHQEDICLEGHELIDEIRDKIAFGTQKICLDFINHYPMIAAKGIDQVGDPSYYPKRTEADSKLNINLLLRDQINILRVSDNEKYPAHFEWMGHKYYLKIYKA